MRVTVDKWRGPHRRLDDDAVAVEEPLEIRLHDEVLALTMRTPGHDRELVLGFLWSEGIITAPGDISSPAPCGKLGDPGRDNTMAVTLAPGVRPPVDPETGALLRRGTLVSSACGVCGRKTLDDLLSRVKPNLDTAPLSANVVQRAVATLAERQPLFAETGGYHAASLVTFAGEPMGRRFRSG
jgi:FdhD protein